jgi:hypothetical protein
VPADLDADGDGEFYASTNDALVRLDGNGREVWRTPLVNASIAFTAPRTSRDSGWIVTSTGGASAAITGTDGKRIANVSFQSGHASGFVDWPDGRHLLVAGDALRVVRLDGTIAFEWRVPDLGTRVALQSSRRRRATPNDGACRSCRETAPWPSTKCSTRCRG